MSRRVAFVGTNGGVSFASRGFEAALEEIGLNVGNALFQYALWDVVSNPKFIIKPGEDIGFVRENADVLVIPAANQVHPEWDMSAWADLVEGLDMPTVVIGLGAQAWINDSTAMEMQPGTMRFLKAASERTSNIGVRGEFTQEVLAKLGIKNTIITGCPSRMINRMVTGASIQEKLSGLRGRKDLRIGHLYGTFEEPARPAESKLSAIVREFEHGVILQTDPKLMRLVLDGQVTDREYISWFGQIARPDLNADNYFKDLRARGMFFSDARSWVDRMGFFDLVIGMRIHGAIAGIAGHTAAICVAFDSRTLELAKSMGIPYLLHTDVEKSDNLDDLLDKVIFDPATYDALQRDCIPRIEAILTHARCVLRS
jgi:hypothetical protein